MSRCMMTMAEREYFYNKREVQKVLVEVKEFIKKNAGYPSQNEELRLVRDGNIHDMPISINYV